MKKILLALTILGAGAGGFLTARQATKQLRHEASATHQTWLAQTQLVAVAQNDQAALITRIRELKQTLAQSPAAKENSLWSALQTNRADRLPPELRELLLEELGFNWRSLADYIVVSKQTVVELMRGSWTIKNGQVAQAAAALLSLAPEERALVEAAMQRVGTDLNEWIWAHVERYEPQDNMLAHYSLPSDPAMSQSITDNFAATLSTALDRERAELLLRSARDWMLSNLGLSRTSRGAKAAMIIKRETAGNEQSLKVEGEDSNGKFRGLLSETRFPPAFRPVFPNGWADVAKAEGFELPEERGNEVNK